MKYCIKTTFILIGAIFFLVIASPCFSHTLYMTVSDNEDGTVTVSGMFSTGGTAAGIPLLLEDGQGKIIKKMKMDDDGEITFEKPGSPYTIILNGGPGHTMREEGPARKAKPK